MMTNSFAFLDTEGIQHSRQDIRLRTSQGFLTGHGRLTLWLRDTRNRYWRYPYTLSETDLTEGVCLRLLTHHGGVPMVGDTAPRTEESAP